MSRDIPPLPERMPPGLDRPLRRMREELQRLTGMTGDDPALLTSQASTIAGGSTTVIGGGGGGGAADEPDLTPPPSVTGLSAVAGITQVIVSWDVAAYTQGHGPQATRLYAVKLPNGDATIPTFPGESALVDSAPHPITLRALPSEPNTRWHLWAKFVTNDGVLSVDPAGGVNGVIVTTGQDVTQLLEILTGEITESQLYAALGDRINLIDGPDTLTGSVAARIKDEHDRAISAEGVLDSRTDALEVTVNDVTTGVAATASALDAVETLVYDGAQGNVALAGRTSVLEATIDNPTTGLAAAYAAISTEAAARASGDSANASSITTLQSRLLTGDLAQFAPYLHWEFNGDSASWVAYPGYGTVSVGAQSLFVLANAGGDAIITRSLSGPIEQFSGAKQNKIRARLRKASGAMVWSGVCFYTTPGHVESTGYYKQIPEPAWGADGWAIAEWDMENLTAGGTDWVDSTITAVRFDLSRAPSAAGEWEIDWISIGNRTQPVSSAALQIEASTRAALDGAVQSLYTVRAEVSGGGRTVVGGFGLAGTATAAEGPRIDFGVRADQFWIASPSGSGTPDSKPFVVRTTPTTENGVSIPAGVYMDSAYIVNVTAAIARMGSAWIDSAKIADGAIVTAKIADAQITTTKIANAQITQALIANAAVGSAQIQDAAITSAKIGAAQVGTAQIADASITSAKITTLSADKITTGSLTGQTITGGTFTGGVFQTASSGKRVILNESGSNEARFYGDRGDGTVEQLASIGINTVGSDSVIGNFGSTNSGNSKTAISARSNTARAITATSQAENGIVGFTNSASASHAGVVGQVAVTGGAANAISGNVASLTGSGAGVRGATLGSGAGVRGVAQAPATGFGGEFYGNGTNAPLYLAPYTTAPSSAPVGALAVILTPSGYRLCYGNGSTWRRVWDDQLWSA